MSKNAKTFLPIAAAIAIPFVAGPLGVALSSSMMFSGTALGTFLAKSAGAAVLGGLMGAGVGALSGRGLEGALIGGATGALGGYAGAGGFAGLGEATSPDLVRPLLLLPALRAISPPLQQRPPLPRRSASLVLRPPQALPPQPQAQPPL